MINIFNLTQKQSKRFYNFSIKIEVTEIIGDKEKIYFILNDTFFSLSESFFYSSKDANIAIGLFVKGCLFIQVQYVVFIDIKCYIFQCNYKLYVGSVRPNVILFKWLSTAITMLYILGSIMFTTRIYYVFTYQKRRILERLQNTLFQLQESVGHKSN